MIELTDRIGRFTSSQIFRLCGTDAVAKTYIEEKRAERCLGRSIDTGAYSQDMTWGKLMEFYAFENEMDMQYQLCSKKVETHPKYKFWSGSPDYKTNFIAGEMKCFQPKKFYELSRDLIFLNDGILSLNEFKKTNKEVYWQVLSNAIILESTKCEIMAYTPTEEQLIDIRKQVEEGNLLERAGIEPWQGRFIYEKKMYELPYIPKHSNWPNIVRHLFTPPVEDVIFLTKKVLEAEKKLSA